MLLRLYNKNNNPKDLEEVIRVLEEEIGRAHV